MNMQPEELMACGHEKKYYYWHPGSTGAAKHRCVRCDDPYGHTAAGKELGLPIKEAVHVRKLTCVMDMHGNETIYVDGVLHPIEGGTIFSMDIQGAAGNQPVVIEHLVADIDARCGGTAKPVWPKALNELPTRNPGAVH
jgi:hypothetical protein